jgi:hypothetical protein
MTTLEEAVFGTKVAKVLVHMEEVFKRLGRYQYTFLDEDEFDQVCSRARDATDEKVRAARTAEFMCIYAREIVFRAHYTALTTLGKMRRWIHGMLCAAREPNCLTFAASYRGLLECAADAADVLRMVPMTLAENHQELIPAIQSRASRVFVCPDLEEALVHYSHGRGKPGKGAPPSHQAKPMRAYLEGLAKEGVPLVHECYSDLCDMTHPGGLGVMWFFDSEDDGGVLAFADNRDAESIAALCLEYQSVFSELLSVCNDAMLTLRVINSFDVPALTVEVVNRWDFGTNPNWIKMKALMPSLDKPPIPTGAAIPVDSRGLVALMTKKASDGPRRNDPCPCKSGKKFKNCCMKRA